MTFVMNIIGMANVISFFLYFCIFIFILSGGWCEAEVLGRGIDL